MSQAYVAGLLLIHEQGGHLYAICNLLGVGIQCVMVCSFDENLNELNASMLYSELQNY